MCFMEDVRGRTATPYVELFKNVMDMRLDRANRDDERVRDLSIAHTMSDKREHFKFAAS